LKEEGNETVTNCHQLKMRAADGTILEKVLGRANIERFPDDFMFELTKDEYDALRCNIFTSNNDSDTLRCKNFTSNKKRR